VISAKPSPQDTLTSTEVGKKEAASDSKTKKKE
jgi:hypothetical protein